MCDEKILSRKSKSTFPIFNKILGSVSNYNSSENFSTSNPQVHYTNWCKAFRHFGGGKEKEQQNWCLKCYWARNIRIVVHCCTTHYQVAIVFPRPCYFRTADSRTLSKMQATTDWLGEQGREKRFRLLNTPLQKVNWAASLIHGIRPGKGRV